MNFKKLYSFGYICLKSSFTRYTFSQLFRKFQLLQVRTLPSILPIYTAIAFMRQNKDNQIDIKEKDFKRMMNEADKLFENGHYEQCYQYLSSVEDSENVEITWRISRVLYNMAKDPKIVEPQKKTLIFDAFNKISKEVNDNQNNYAVHKWYAILLDVKSSYEGLKERIKQLNNVKKHMDLAVSLNPEDATTLHMLGEWCYQIAEMPWHQRKIAETLFASPPYSSYEDALEYFLKAESVQPRFYSVNLLRLGACYSKLKKEDQAKYYLKLAASYPPKSNDDHMANKEAAELLKKFKNG